MQDDDIELVEKACLHYCSYGDKDTYQAFERILSRTLPELSNGWQLDGIFFYDELIQARIAFYKGNGCTKFENGYGQTPRQAVENAIKKIKE